MLRAAVSIGGLLASTRDDSVYRAVLRGWRASGAELRLQDLQRRYDADWWSITAYGWDFYLIPNSEKRYSFNNREALRRMRLEIG